MTTEAPAAPIEAPPAPPLSDLIFEKVKGSPHPLKLAEVIKAAPKPPKVKPAAYKQQVNEALAEGLRSGRVFSALSGKNGEARFWGRDERHLLRERGVQLAGTPQELAKLRAKLAKEVKGADAAYVEGLLRELIGEGVLHQHPGKKAPLFGSSPPTPPLEAPAHAKALAALAVSVEKLIKKAGVDVAAVLAALGQRLATARPADPVMDSPPPLPTPAAPHRLTEAEVEQSILEAVEREGTMSLKDLRRSMPADANGPLFDEAVLRLEGRGRVSLGRDFDPTHFSPVERAEYVQEGDILFTSIAKRS